MPRKASKGRAGKRAAVSTDKRGSLSAANLFTHFKLPLRHDFGEDDRALVKVAGVPTFWLDIEGSLVLTLILSQASLSYSIQVADRLVSLGGKPLDPRFNKTILFFANNAVASMTFTGLATVGETPTDLWIAEKITGMKRILTEDSQVPVCSTFRFPSRDIGYTLRQLSSALTNVKRDIPTHYHLAWTQGSLELAIVGYQWNRRRMFRPLVAALCKPPGSAEVFVDERKPRDWYYPRPDGLPTFRGAAPVGNISAEDLDCIWQRCQSIWGGVRATNVFQVIDDTERIMVEALQDVSQNMPGIVGSDAISIVITNPNHGVVRIRYVPERAQYTMAASAAGKIQVPLFYAPWVVIPGHIQAPTCMINSILRPPSFGRYKIEIDNVLIPTAGWGSVNSERRPTL